MIDLHDAIRELHPEAVVIRGDEAFDINEQPIVYNMADVDAKLAELQAAAEAAEQAKVAAKESAIAKLSALGLTADEIAHLIP